jgi:hypothetical protein
VDADGYPVSMKVEARSSSDHVTSVEISPELEHLEVRISGDV